MYFAEIVILVSTCVECLGVVEHIEQPLLFVCIFGQTIVDSALVDAAYCSVLRVIRELSAGLVDTYLVLRNMDYP